MELALLAFCFVTALIISCLLILGVLWITDKRYKAKVRQRKERREAWDRYRLVTRHTERRGPSEEDWQFPEPWNPTKGETHLGKTKIGGDAP